MKTVLPLLDGDTLMLDNSKLEFFTQCARKGEYRILHNRIPADDKAALNFGAAIHSALELRYRVRGASEVDLETEARQLLLLEKWWEKSPTPFGDHRTLGLAQQTIQRYNRRWLEEPFLPVKLEGNFLVEQPFAMPLGTVSFQFHPDSTTYGNGKFPIKVVWTGRIDLVVCEGNDFYVMDHKTSSIGGDYFMTEFAMSAPLMGYCWAAWKRYGVKIGGGIVNGLVVRKPAKTQSKKEAKTDPFPRQKFFFDEERLIEWQTNTLRLVQQFINYYQEGFFPMHQKQCVTKYGKCDYWNVCTLSQGARLPYLHSSDYRDDDWSPLVDRPVSIDEVLAVPAAELSYPTAQPVEAEPTIDISELTNL